METDSVTPWCESADSIAVTIDDYEGTVFIAVPTETDSHYSNYDPEIPDVPIKNINQ